MLQQITLQLPRWNPLTPKQGKHPQGPILAHPQNSGGWRPHLPHLPGLSPSPEVSPGSVTAAEQELPSESSQQTIHTGKCGVFGGEQ